jgi:hypothetical protein
MSLVKSPLLTPAKFAANRRVVTSPFGAVALRVGTHASEQVARSHPLPRALGMVLAERERGREMLRTKPECLTESASYIETLRLQIRFDDWRRMGLAFRVERHRYWNLEGDLRLVREAQNPAIGSV